MHAGMRLRTSLGTGRIVRLAGAHNPLGARLVERAGFDGVWASSLELTASRAIPDAGVLTMRECLAGAGALARAVGIPVVADCDTGFGDAHAVARLVRRFEAADVAGVCIEDQPSPKINSLADGPHALVPVGEFTAKLRAAKQAQRAPHFVVIARTEALIAGLGVEEALRRAHAYAAAGADAILVHNKARTAAPVTEFLAAWTGDAPIVIVPTTYPECTAADLETMGVRMVIYANHGLRAAVRAMEETFAGILREGRTAGLEGRLATIREIFAIQEAPRSDPAAGSPEIAA
jgi:phosphoenolpyruvate phosphomutase